MRKRKESTTITFAELMEELDKYRTGHSANIQLTAEQKQFLKACRSEQGKRPVPWKVIAELWNKMGWIKLNQNAIRYRYELLTKNRSI